MNFRGKKASKQFQDAPKTRARRLGRFPRRLQDGPKTAPRRLKAAPRGVQDASKLVQDRFKKLPKKLPRHLNMPPRLRKHFENGLKCIGQFTVRSRCYFRITLKMSNTVESDSKTALRRVANALRCLSRPLQDGLGTLQGGLGNEIRGKPQLLLLLEKHPSCSKTILRRLEDASKTLQKILQYCYHQVRRRGWNAEDRLLACRGRSRTPFYRPS